MGNNPAKKSIAQGILPDYKVEMSPADIVNGSAQVPEFVLKFIDKK